MGKSRCVVDNLYFANQGFIRSQQLESGQQSSRSKSNEEILRSEKGRLYFIQQTFQRNSRRCTYDKGFGPESSTQNRYECSLPRKNVFHWSYPNKVEFRVV